MTDFDILECAIWSFPSVSCCEIERLVSISIFTAHHFSSRTLHVAVVPHIFNHRIQNGQVRFFFQLFGGRAWFGD